MEVTPQGKSGEKSASGGGVLAKPASLSYLAPLVKSYLSERLLSYRMNEGSKGYIVTEDAP